MVVAWQLTNAGHERERCTLHISGVAFLAQALYILVQRAVTLISNSRPSLSHVGTAWLIATVVTMLWLSSAKHRPRFDLNNPVLVTGAKVPFVECYLTAAVFVGLTLNAQRSTLSLDDGLPIR